MKAIGSCTAAKTFGEAVFLSAVLTAAFLIVIGCQGRPSQRAPIHLNPNMDLQPKYKAQAGSAFFEDGMAMRSPVEGTVARGHLRDDDVYWRGIDPQTQQPTTANPVPVTQAGLERGRERFNIFCAVCHDQTGSGRGIVVQKGFMSPPSFHTDPIRNLPDGHIFSVISSGIRNMPAYGPQIPVRDRWLIVQYVRALQRSQNAALADVPAENREELK